MYGNSFSKISMTKADGILKVIISSNTEGQLRKMEDTFKVELLKEAIMVQKTVEFPVVAKYYYKEIHLLLVEEGKVKLLIENFKKEFKIQ